MSRQDYRGRIGFTDQADKQVGQWYGLERAAAVAWLGLRLVKLYLIAEPLEFTDHFLTKAVVFARGMRNGIFVKALENRLRSGGGKDRKISPSWYHGRCLVSVYTEPRDQAPDHQHPQKGERCVSRVLAIEQANHLRSLGHDLFDEHWTSTIME